MRLVAVLLVALCLSADAARILGMFSFQGRSHSAMYVPLMKELARRGHEVTVVSHFPQKSPPANYTDVSLQGSLPINTNRFTIEFVRRFNMYTELEYLWVETLNFCETMMQFPVLKDFINSTRRFDLVITQVFVADCFLGVAHQLGNPPLVGIVTSVMLPWANPRVANPDNPAYIPNYFLPYSSRMDFTERLVNTVTTIYSSLGFELFASRGMDDINRRYLSEEVPSTWELARKTSLILVNSHFTVNHARPMVPAVVEVAGLHIPAEPKPLPPELQRFLDGASEERGAVLFTFGSMVRTDSLPVDTLRAFQRAFQRLSPQRFLWKADAAALAASGVVLSDNVRTADWLPQYDVLCHPNIRAFISHGGLFGTLEAVHTGVPVLGIPLFADQKLNVPNLVRLGMAIQMDVDRITDDELVDALTNLTAPGSQYRARARELSALFRDRPRSPLDEAVYWVEYVLRHGGAPHLRSAALDLYWFQYLLIDVAAFVLAMAALFATAAYFAIWRVVSRLRKERTGKKKIQ